MKKSHKLATLVCSVILGTATLSVSATSLVTTDHQVLQVPTNIGVFNAQQVKTPQRFVNLINQQTIDALNKGIREGLQESGKDTKQAEFASYQGNLIKNLNFYQLQGENEQGHHVAYIGEILLDPSYRDLIPADKRKGDKKYNPTSAFSELLNLEKKNTTTYGNNAESANIAIQKELAKQMPAMVENFQKSMLAAAAKQAGKPGARTFTKEDMALWTNYYKTINLKYTYYEPSQTVMTNLGKAIYQENRGYMMLDNLQYPMTTFSLIRFTNEGPVLTLIYVNDPSFNFWQKEVKSIWGIK